MYKQLILSLVLIAMIGMASGSTVIFEAGPYAIIMDKTMDIMDVSNTNFWPGVFGFEPIQSRDLVKSNYYELKFTGLLEKDSSGIIGVPEFIEISEKPLEGGAVFTPKQVKDITVGRLRPVKTTLLTGEYSGKTPYFVEFTVDGFYCRVYNPNTDESSMTDFLQKLDIIKKDDIGKYAANLWSNED